MHRLDDLVRWGDSSATSNETNLGLLEDFALDSEVTISKICQLSKRWLHDDLIANFETIQILCKLLLWILLCLFIDLDHKVDCALLIYWTDRGVRFVWWQVAWLVENADMLGN